MEVVEMASLDTGDDADAEPEAATDDGADATACISARLDAPDDAVEVSSFVTVECNCGDEDVVAVVIVSDIFCSATADEEVAGSGTADAAETDIDESMKKRDNHEVYRINRGGKRHTV